MQVACDQRGGARERAASMQGGRGSGKHLVAHRPGCEMGFPEWFSREDPLGTGRNMVHHWSCSPQELRLWAGMEVAWRRS
jgi:hypothetical protein